MRKAAASYISSRIAVLGASLAKEAGSIYPEAVQQAQAEGRELTGMDLARVWATSLLAGGVDAITDSLGLDVAVGRIRLGVSRIVSAARGAVLGTASQLTSEEAQTVMERIGAGKSLTSDEATADYFNSGALSILGGSSVGLLARPHSSETRSIVSPAKGFAPHEIAAAIGTPDDVIRSSTRPDGVIVLNTDDIVSRTPQMKAARTLTEGKAAHVALKAQAGKVRDAAFDQLLKRPVTPADETIIITAGGQGSGKSRAIRNEAGPAVVYDTIFGDFKNASKIIDKIVATGRRVQIRYVHREFGAAVRGNFFRAADENRISTAADIAKAHSNARRTIAALVEKYNGSHDVIFDISRNNADTMGKMSVSEMLAVEKPSVDELTQKAYEIANEIERRGESSKEALRVFRGLEGSGRTPGR